jgi:hypothetical protein
VIRLAETLAEPESNGEAREDIRSLVGEVVITPGEKRGENHATLRGELMAVLDLAAGRRRPPRPEVITNALAGPRNQDLIVISVRWPASGGLFHFLQFVLSGFRNFTFHTNDFQQFRRNLQSVSKSSTAQNWHKTAQKFSAKTLLSAPKNRKDLVPTTACALALFSSDGAIEFVAQVECRRLKAADFDSPMRRFEAPPQPKNSLIKHTTDTRMTTHSHRFHVASCRKNFCLFSRPPKVCRRLHATWFLSQWHSNCRVSCVVPVSFWPPFISGKHRAFNYCGLIREGLSQSSLSAIVMLDTVRRWQ